MISVENFYWVIFENLLKPCKIDCAYFYPFGSLQNISSSEYNTWQRFKSSHLSMFLDQEPLYQFNLEKVDEHILRGNCFKNFKILANSEISQQKKDYCQSREFADWYFFYHGFACLDWFSDCKFIKDEHEIKTAFICLNHLVTHKRSYRMALLARIVESGAWRSGCVSFHGTPDQCIAEITDANTELSEHDKNLVSEHLVGSKINIPWILDNPNVNGNFSARCGFHEYKLWQESLFHIVTETVFYDRRLHLTEKIFKPIVAGRPFILVAAPGNLSYLKRYGFRTFDRWIDERYDDIIDNDQRLDHISREITRIGSLSKAELNEMQNDMRSVTDHNKKHFFGDFKRIIVDEMIDNFETCLKLWNNGRVKYNCPNHPGLQQIKELFYQ